MNKFFNVRFPSWFRQSEPGVLLLSVFAFPLLWPIIFSVPEEDDPGPAFNVMQEEAAMPEYSVKAYDMPDEIDFAGERVPLYNEDIQERLDREILVNTYWHSQTFLFFKRANKWFPVIEPILEEKGVPDDFKYMVLIESGLTNAVSPAGAVGFWQLMERTAKSYGLVVNDEVDERYHVEKSTKVAADYLVGAYEQFGNWTLAAASYNMGVRGVKRVQERQNVYPYYDMALNPETARFVFRILAVKEIFENPRHYGFHFTQDQLYSQVEMSTVEVEGSVDSWVDFAKEHDITYKELRMHNPWIRDRQLRNRGNHTFEVHIPVRSARDTVSVNIPEDEIFANVRERKRKITGAPGPELPETKVHKVQPEETIHTIAEKYQVQASSIKQWNNMEDADELQPGNEIKIKFLSE